MTKLRAAQDDFKRAEDLWKEHALPEVQYQKAIQTLDLMKAELRNETNAQAALLLLEAKDTLTRTQQLYKEHLISESDFQEAQLAYELASLRASGDRNHIASLETQTLLKAAEAGLKRATQLYKDRLISEAAFQEAQLAYELVSLRASGDTDRIAFLENQLLLKAAEAHLKRADMLYKDKVISKRKFEEAELRVRTLKNRVQASSGGGPETTLEEAKIAVEEGSKLYQRKLIGEGEYKSIYQQILPAFNEAGGNDLRLEPIESLRGRASSATALVDVLTVGRKDGVVDEAAYDEAVRSLRTIQDELDRRKPAK
jgi:multidrug resistance efflux pump